MAITGKVGIPHCERRKYVFKGVNVFLGEKGEKKIALLVPKLKSGSEQKFQTNIGRNLQPK